MDGVLEIDLLARLAWPSSNTHGSLRSLKKLVLHFLDAKLSKRMQCSDWSHRPLHSAQLEYAICDSVVLLRLYDVIIGDINDMCGDAEGVGYDHTQLLQTYMP